MLKKIIINKEQITTACIILICLILYGIFPVSGIFQNLMSSFAFLILVPFLYIKIVLKRSPSDYGFRVGDARQGILWGAFSLIFALLILYIVINFTDFVQNYYIPAFARRFFLFLLYELFIIGFFVLLYESFFRGFVQHSFARKLGIASVVLQAFLFIAFLALTQNLDWSVFPFVLFSPLSGIIAYRSSSLIYSFASALLFIIITDAILISLTR